MNVAFFTTAPRSGDPVFVYRLFDFAFDLDELPALRRTVASSVDLALDQECSTRIRSRPGSPPFARLIGAHWWPKRHGSFTSCTRIPASFYFVSTPNGTPRGAFAEVESKETASEFGS